MRRHRILRKSAAIRDLISETNISPKKFIVPIFLTEGSRKKEEIATMPGYFRYSLDELPPFIEEHLSYNISAFLLFAKVSPEKKTNDCQEALNEEGLLPKAIRFLKERYPSCCLMSDVALDPYSPFGHDGLVRDYEILNDETVEVLAKMSVLHAQCGVDFVAPSDMMDGRVAAIRQALESHGLTKTGIVSYAAKYASSFYGPFRDALDSAPGFGDKKTYQMDFRNRREAVKEVETDIAEGADIILIKPAGFYLDIILEVKNRFHLPIAAYQVSGEYAMIKAAAEKGYVKLEDAMIESLTAIFRAGADLVASYFALEAAKILKGA
ncbi:MAG: porphobilinogen synthase [Leptospiraceae bacterium]|nr:porphobilinogen synthase [Leptospiraceae bacterium]MDW8307035.1 porphobilinogen synthase [Leptospiraceae bacterium]